METPVQERPSDDTAQPIATNRELSPEAAGRFRSTMLLNWIVILILAAAVLAMGDDVRSAIATALARIVAAS